MIKKIDIFKDKIPKQMIKTGGYSYFDKKFPFYHFKKEEIYIMTEEGIYKWELKNENNQYRKENN